MPMKNYLPIHYIIMHILYRSDNGPIYIFTIEKPGNSKKGERTINWVVVIYALKNQHHVSYIIHTINIYYFFFLSKYRYFVNVRWWFCRPSHLYKYVVVVMMI